MSYGFDPIYTITSDTDVYRNSLKIRPITLLNATQSLRFCSTNNEKHSTPYIKIGRHLVKTISHNAGSDRFPHLCNTANNEPKNFLQFKSTFILIKSPFGTSTISDVPKLSSQTVKTSSFIIFKITYCIIHILNSKYNITSTHVTANIYVS